MGVFPALVLFSVLRIWSELCFSSSGFVVLCFQNLVRALFCSFVLFSMFLLYWVCSVLFSFIKITYSLKKKKWITYSACFYYVIEGGNYEFRSKIYHKKESNSSSLRTSFKGREKVKNHILDQMLVFGSHVDLELVVYTSRDNLAIEFVGFLACSRSSF
jgi:hypothetical protein